MSAMDQGIDNMTWTPVNVFEKRVGATQDTYSPRFVAYLARFLVNYDRCVRVLVLRSIDRLNGETTSAAAAGRHTRRNFARRSHARSCVCVCVCVLCP